MADGLAIGDVVRIGPNRTKAPEGAVGMIHQFSGSGTPIVDVPRKGRYLVNADALAPHDGPLPTARGDDPPLGDTLPAPIPPPQDPAPAFDWFERPQPESATIATTATEEMTTMPGAWTDERRAKFRETMARKREEKAAAMPGPEPAPEPVAANAVAVAEPAELVPSLERAIAPIAEAPSWLAEGGMAIRAVIARAAGAGADLGTLKRLIAAIELLEDDAA